MEKLEYYRNIEELPPAPICNIILNGKLVFDEFLMSTILELILNKNLEVKDDIIFYKNSNNITGYQFDVLNLLFNNFDKCYVGETRMVWKQVEFVRRIEYKTDANYIKLFEALQEEAKKRMTSPERIYVETINKLKSNRNIVYKVEPKFSILRDDRLEFVTMCNTSEVEQNIILYNFEKISNFNNKSIRLNEIKDLYINNFALRKINNLTLYSENNLLKELYKKDIFNRNLKSLTREGKKIKEKILALKNFINDYSFLKEKDFSNYSLWGEYLSYATALGICRKIEGIAENYTIQIDDIIEDIKKLATF